MVTTPRAIINQVFQLGAEPVGTPGTGGAADQQLGTFNTQIGPVASGAFGVFRPSGGKYVGQIVPTDLYAEGPFTDTIDFNTIPFLFAGNVGWVAATAVSGVSTWRHTPVPFGVGTQRSFVSQEGQIGAVYNYNNVIIPDLNLRFMRTGASQIGGRIIGKKLAPGTTLTTATLRSGRSITGLKTGVWTSDTWAHLVADSGLARLDPKALDISIRHNGLFAPWFALDDSVTSFAGTLDTPADAGIQITVVADVGTADMAGIFTYASMNAGTELFLQILNTGINIPGSSTPYSLKINMCVEISGPPRRSAVGPLRVWQWDALLVPNRVTSPYLPLDITVINDLPVDAIA